MRVSEVYASAQGEGPNVGHTTVFVRFGGCNLRCAGWPCDTQHAIDPAYRHEWKKYTPLELLERVSGVARDAGARLITLTGGEPLLQQNEELAEFTLGLAEKGYSMDAFSNGTIEYPLWWSSRITTIMDWKLPGSGEFERADTVSRSRNLRNLHWDARYYKVPHSVKFVIKDVNDFVTATHLWSSHLEERLPALQVFYGRVWDTPDISDAELVELVMESRLPWRLNRQEHNYIWPAHERLR